ncbi:MAG: elongation factor P [Erysipelotrichaceae bacterium]|nr:elongation factor P [Erysipelotrichaceae bacterium]
MISVGDLRPGMTFQYEGNLYVVLEYSHNKTARAAANIRIKMKNMRTGSTTEVTFGNSEKVARAHIEKRKMQYLYDDGTSLVFMDNETYDQIEIPSDRLEWEINFLKPSDEVEVTSFENEVLGVQLPVNVPFTVTETEPAVKGDTATGATKNATIETGYQIKVPLFISEGEVVIVNTIDGKYQGRAK